MLENATKRDFLSANFEMTKELLGTSISTESALFGSTDLGPLPVLPWIPKTTAAVALRLFELDGSITYIQHEKAEPSEDKSAKVHLVSFFSSSSVSSFLCLCLRLFPFFLPYFHVRLSWGTYWCALSIGGFLL